MLTEQNVRDTGVSEITIISHAHAILKLSLHIPRCTFKRLIVYSSTCGSFGWHDKINSLPHLSGNETGDRKVHGSYLRSVRALGFFPSSLETESNNNIPHESTAVKSPSSLIVTLISFIII